MFARFDENPAMTLQDIKRTLRTDGGTQGHTHNMKKVYVQYAFIVASKYRSAPSKAVVEVDRPIKGTIHAYTKAI